jgi:hypothetical protein
MQLAVTLMLLIGIALSTFRPSCSWFGWIFMEGSGSTTMLCLGWHLAWALVVLPSSQCGLSLRQQVWDQLAVGWTTSFFLQNQFPPHSGLPEATLLHLSCFGGSCHVYISF